ncbi:TetR family transcriptional regulator C-terminal domain-containing protein [Nocardia sp. CA-135398]|uniref:TetR family transcriptional regulator C-terminal domain-containing protein n=1 Tax=Nocardia sp. CA-135398 TaxID=3239977 RepID=UPI003D9874F1
MAIVTAAFRSVSESHLKQLREAMAAVVSPPAKIAQLVRTLETSDTGGAAICMDVWRLGRTNDALRAELDRQNGLWSDAVEDVLHEGIRLGVFRVEDPATSAFKLIVAVDGLFTQRLTQAADASTLIEMATTFADAELGLVPPATVAPAAHPVGGS